MLDQKEDQYYAEKVLEGEKEAFRYFVKKYQKMAMSAALGILRNEELAADAVQNAFIHAFKRLKSFKGASSFSTWFYKIVVNDSLKIARKEKRYQAAEDKQDIWEVELTFNEALTALENSERKTLVANVLLKMKPKEALVLRMYYLEEFSVADIEERTHLKTSNIKVLLHRARKNFMTSISKGQKDHE